MPFIESSQEWLTLSAQLLEARPTTTRVTTKYSISPAKVRAAKKSETADADTPMTDAPASKPPRGKLIIKTYDPQSGVCLKYKTSKAAEVGRLVQMLGSLGRNMGGLKSAPITAPTVEEEVGAVAGTATPPVAAAAAPVAGSGDGGKGKKKKKGKR
ncbi:hypothetical protein N0V93_005044 [Gnomoniopsis smithogilvyi]|uniref:SRP9 domain-containing protein n=1 Tax=Gnomoniopsis smithogilvyi TaxID=1191159 RepID=A0A9W9CWD1_9PEZI|nr:hypothetical protein N0V93_005044 [Gnomoniopsis smithogilvyi]